MVCYRSKVFNSEIFFQTQPDKLFVRERRPYDIRIKCPPRCCTDGAWWSKEEERNIGGGEIKIKNNRVSRSSVRHTRCLTSCRCSGFATFGPPCAAGARRRSDATLWRWTTFSARARITSSSEAWTVFSGCTACTPRRRQRPICITRRPICWSKCTPRVPCCRCARGNSSGQYADVLVTLRTAKRYYLRNLL